MKYVYTFLFLFSGVVVGDETTFYPLCDILDCSKKQMWNCVVDERVDRHNSKTTITNRNTDLYEIEQYEETFFVTNLMTEESFDFHNTTRLDTDDLWVSQCYLKWPIWECFDSMHVFSLNAKTGRAYLVNTPSAWLFEDKPETDKDNYWTVETLNCIKR